MQNIFLLTATQILGTKMSLQGEEKKNFLFISISKLSKTFIVFEPFYMIYHLRQTTFAAVTNKRKVLLQVFIVVMWATN
jgi:hypothetical protein